jgi:Xaa-Pro dipeptidase
MIVDTRQTKRGKFVDIDRLRRTIDAGPFDAVIVNSPENIPYYSGFWNADLRGIPERMHFVLWPRGGEPTFIVGERRYRALLPGDTFLTDVAAYPGEGLDAAQALVDKLSTRGIKKGRIGIEGRNFPASVFQYLLRQLPNVQFVDAFGFLEGPRLIKTSAEIDLLQRLAAWTSDAIKTAFQAARPGDTERAVASRMQYELLRHGADLIAFTDFGTGERSGYFHGLASDKTIEEGMVIKTDFGGMLDGYFSDIARTAVMGRASDRQRDLHAYLTEIKHRVVAAIRPGMLASEVATLGRRAYAERGLEYKWSILGHSIGLGLHESPQIYPWVDEPIQTGMVMMIEVGYTDYPHDSFHVEDMILITERDARYLSDDRAHETLWEIGV